MTAPASDATITPPQWPPFMVDRRLAWKGDDFGFRWVVLDARGAIRFIGEKEERQTADARAVTLNNGGDGR